MKSNDMFQQYKVEIRTFTLSSHFGMNFLDTKSVIEM